MIHFLVNGGNFFFLFGSRIQSIIHGKFCIKLYFRIEETERQGQKRYVVKRVNKCQKVSEFMIIYSITGGSHMENCKPFLC